MEANFVQLRKEFETELKTRKDVLNEFDLRRGLQGHNNDIDYVRKHLRAHLRFLSSMDWSKFEKHPVLQKYYPWGFVGDTGKNNDTFLYMKTVGRADPDGLLNTAPISTIILDRLYDTEGMIRQLRQYENETGRQAKILFVFDMEEFTLDSSWLSVLGRQFKVGSKFFSDRYSEILHKVVVVNCPSYVYYVWRMMQPILPEMTRRKVEIYADDWKEKLLQHVVPDRLPAHWGGTMTDENGDPMCRSKLVVPPGKIPKDLHWHPSADDPTPDQCRQLAISAGQFEYVDVKITESELKEKGGCVRLKWYFTTSGDFSFGVFYRSDDDHSENAEDHMNMEMVYPFFEHLPGPTTVPENAQIECKKPGVYKLRFGNEMGWWSKLNITFSVKCI